MPARSALKMKMKSKSKVKAKKTTKAKAKTKAGAVAKKVSKKLVAKKAAPKIKILGRVVHHYDRIGVTIVELATAVKVGDKVMFKRPGQEFCQKITSMQIEHESVKTAKKKQIVGIKSDEETQKGMLMLAA
jgi:hypothetical protein